MDAHAVTIRAARPDDKRAVRALCRRIWSDDYVLEVFDEWVRDRRGKFWVAIAGKNVIGIGKLTLVGDREAWLHALRVDPRYRRRGVATALLEHRLARARRLGARAARLDTAEDNVAVRRLMRTHGFRRIDGVAYFAAPARGIAAPRRASAVELARLSRLAAQEQCLLHEAYVVRRLTRADVARAIVAGMCFVSGPPGGATAFALAETQRRTWHGPRVAVRALGGTPRGVRELMGALRGHAKASGVKRAVSIATPARFWRALRLAGYRKRPETMLIFERAL
jgi:N-acetylglutamate synthase-like GNAT family acetyltransferase